MREAERMLIPMIAATLSDLGMVAQMSTVGGRHIVRGYVYVQTVPGTPFSPHLTLRSHNVVIQAATDEDLLCWADSSDQRLSGKVLLKGMSLGQGLLL